MSNVLILAAATSLLKSLLENGLVTYEIAGYLGGDIKVSSLPPSRLDSGEDERPQINIFLYQVSPKGLYLGNRYGEPGERIGTAHPESLDLYYLISAYGGQDLQIEILLGYALEVFRETPQLSQGQIRKMLSGSNVDGGHQSSVAAALMKSDLPDRMSRITICPQVTSIQDAHALWSALQTAFRPSHIVRATIVLDDSGIEGSK